jgi:ATPase family associated with various cellular activities (AAA)/Winged helix domain, variant
MSAELTTQAADQGLGLELEIESARRLLAAAARGESLASAEREVSPRSAALESVVSAFGLDEFERFVLLICAGFELDVDFGRLCAQALEGGPPYPTLGLAAAVLPNPHPGAFLPVSPLRRWRLVELASGPSLTTCPVHIDERLLVHLLGSDQLDNRLAGIVRPVTAARTPFPTQARLAAQVAAAWQQSWEDPVLPTIQVAGNDPELVRSVSLHAAFRLGLGMLVADADTLPLEPRELDGLARLWWREAELQRRLMVVDSRRVDLADPVRFGSIRRLIEAIGQPIMVETTAQQPLDGRKHLYFRVPALDATEQREMWLHELEPRTPEISGHQLDKVVSQYRLPAAEIAAVAAEAKAGIASDATTDLGDALWLACRSHVRPRLGSLAKRIEPRARWEDLVLPRPQLALLHMLALQVVQRYQVYERWGFGRRTSRGLGLASVFYGPSGTGKTMAAEVVAAELGLDLYRVDLSQVVNKYVGETEKNLGRIFDAADVGAGCLALDEAEALFSKRSGEVRDSHDRYGAIETGYLLQRMEDYRGLAILTTNMKEALDPAFLRRFRFTVEFPFPDATMRAEIWRHVIPPETPTSDLDFERLAQLNLSGGSIKNIALNAAFLAAADESAVVMPHLMSAARLESAKLQRPLTSGELRGWS